MCLINEIFKSGNWGVTKVGPEYSKLWLEVIEPQGLEHTTDP